MPEPFNLLSARWLPVRRHDGTRETMAPAAITDRIDTNPVVALDWPRADFRLAGLEFLVGLIATACPPRDGHAWLEHWRGPPAPDALDAAFAPIRHAFELDGSGPRFMQDLEDLPGEPDTPETLLIEAPGEAALRKNTTLLVKRGRVTVLSRATAAIALYTLQTYAPLGGSGHRVSLRGGGPLTTLIVPGSHRADGVLPLWHLVWANVSRGAPPQNGDLPRVFPWLASTRTSDNGRKTTPADGHPLQVFWGMPRRIHLDFAEAAGSTRCDLTGDADGVVVVGWRQKKHGVQYEAWVHPLSPYRADKMSGGRVAVHPQPGGIGYRHWVGLLFDLPHGISYPANAISTWLSERARDAAQGVEQLGLQSRILAGGYDMDNMKARAFVESEMPLIVARDPDAQAAEAAFAHALVTAADEAARALRGALRTAQFDQKTVFDATPLSAVAESLWSRTHDPFFGLMRRAAAELDREAEADLSTLRADWLRTLRNNALAVFDMVAPLDVCLASFRPPPEERRGRGSEQKSRDQRARVPRIVEARRHLAGAFAGYGASGTTIFNALGLPRPEQRPKGRKSTRSKETA